MVVREAVAAAETSRRYRPAEGVVDGLGTSLRPSRRLLYRVRHVDELGRDAESLRQVLAQGADAQPLGRVVAGGEVVDSGLAGHVHDPLGDLARNVGVQSVLDGVVEFPLGAAADD